MHFIKRYHWLVHTVAALNVGLIAFVAYKIIDVRFQGYTWRVFVILAIPLIGIFLLYRRPWIGRWVFITFLSFGLLRDFGALAAQAQNPGHTPPISTIVTALVFGAFRCWLLWQLLLGPSFLSYMSQLRAKPALQK